MPANQITLNEWNNVIRETKELLENNKADWLTSFDGYANDINKNLRTLAAKRKLFNEWKPLYLYINTSRLEGKKRVIHFELRFFGRMLRSSYAIALPN